MALGRAFGAVGGGLPGTVDEHIAVVQFRAQNGQVYQVYWDTFGLMYNACTCVEAVLERNLLNGYNRGRFFVSDAELFELMTRASFGLHPCLWLKKRVAYDEHEAHPLRLKQLSEMFSRQKAKQWQVLSPGNYGDDDLSIGEIRILFARGGYSCLPDCVEEALVFVTETLYGQKNYSTQLFPAGGLCDYSVDLLAHARKTLDVSSPRCKQISEELREPFLRKLREAAQVNLRALEQALCEQGENVVVRRVTKSGEELAVVWDGSVVHDRDGKKLLDFLQACVMQGTSLGYTDENAVRHYAFINDSIGFMLCSSLSLDLDLERNVKHYGWMPLLKSSHLRGFVQHAWCVVPQGRQMRPYRDSWVITFAGAMLVGVPLIVEQEKMYGGLTPRCFLWGLEFENFPMKPPNQTWYDFGKNLSLEKIQWCLE